MSTDLGLFDSVSTKWTIVNTVFRSRLPLNADVGNFLRKRDCEVLLLNGAYVVVCALTTGRIDHFPWFDGNHRVSFYRLGSELSRHFLAVFVELYELVA